MELLLPLHEIVDFILHLQVQLLEVGYEEDLVVVARSLGQLRVPRLHIRFQVLHLRVVKHGSHDEGFNDCQRCLLRAEEYIIA